MRYTGVFTTETEVLNTFTDLSEFDFVINKDEVIISPKSH